MLQITLRTVLVYLFLIATVRLMGKRQIGELEISELIITFMLSEVAAGPIINEDVSLLSAFVPIAVLLGIEVILSKLLMRFPLLKILIAGRPSIVIENGHLRQKELRRQRMCVSELISALRQQGIADISDVCYAILEGNGRLSVFPKASRSPVTPEQLCIAVDEGGIAVILIIDGKIIKNNLTEEWSEEKIHKHLQKNGLSQKDVFLMWVSPDGTPNHIIKEK